MDNEQLDQIEEDVSELKEWTRDHRKEHTADTNLLSSIIDKIDSHQNNHHGRLSMVKQSGAIGAALAAVGGVAELLRRLFL
jgi:hypothetical protein